MITLEYYQKIRNMREDLDLKQYEFAELINVLPKTYNLYENGIRTIPWSVLSKILQKLNVSMDYILELSEQQCYPNLRKIQVEEIASNFKNYRKKMNLSQKEMATYLNCSQQTLSSYENGNLRIPIDTFKKFCQITQISADTISGRTSKVQILKNNSKKATYL